MDTTPAQNLNDDEWEEVTIVADLKGVLDVGTVTRALEQNNVALRFANTDKPVIQVGPSVFSGEWNKTLGTDIIYRESTSPAVQDGSDNAYEIVAHSSTRLTATKSILSKEKE